MNFSSFNFGFFHKGNCALANASAAARRSRPYVSAVSLAGYNHKKTPILRKSLRTGAHYFRGTTLIHVYFTVYALQSTETLNGFPASVSILQRSNGRSRRSLYPVHRAVGAQLQNHVQLFLMNFLSANRSFSVTLGPDPV